MNINTNRYCVIDIGTNSTRMLIAQYHKACLHTIKKDMEMTRIGEGVDKTKLLSQRGMNDTIEALIKFKEEALKHNVFKIYAIATSAVRDAQNKNIFIERSKKEAEIDIEIIDGQREAELGFKGILRGLKSNGDILAIDIGGGSTELILGGEDGIKYSTSIDIGAVRLTDKFIINDPISSKELENLKGYIQDNIYNHLNEIKRASITKVVGIGGTITTLAAIKQELDIYNREKIHGFLLTKKDIKSMIHRFIAMSIEERKGIKGLQPKRADIIPAGILILAEILDIISWEEIVVSDYDNLEGFIFDKIYY